MIGRAAKASAQCPCFGKVAQSGAGCVGLNSAEIGGADVGSVQSIINGSAGLQPLGFRGDDVMGITVAAASQQPSSDC